MKKEPCFACGRPMASKYLVRCIDEQTAFVGSECFSKVRAGGSDGWQPTKGGPRLFTLQVDRSKTLTKEELC